MFRQLFWDKRQLKWVQKQLLWDKEQLKWVQKQLLWEKQLNWVEFYPNLVTFAAKGAIYIIFLLKTTQFGYF